MTALVALAVGALTFGVALVLLTTRRRMGLHRRLTHFVGGNEAEKARTKALEGSKLAEVVNRLLTALRQQQRVALLLDRAGIDGEPGASGGIALLATFALAVLALIASGPGAAAVAVVGAPALALIGLVWRGRRRAQAFEAQLPEILDTLCASLRAGHSFHHALQNLSDDVAEPAHREFRRVVAEVQLGRALEGALADLGERIGSEDFMFVLDAITIQRQVGGSMAELFEMVAHTVRGRIQFRRNLRAATGMPRTSAKVLTGLPLVAALLLTLVNRSYMSPLFTSTAGLVLCSITVMLMLVGGTILRQIGSVRP